MKMQGNMAPPKTHTTTISKSKAFEVAEMLDKEFKSLFLKVISDLKEDSNK
jgi:hypothetical protein